MFTVDKYLGLDYDFNKYNCSHFVSEVWQDLTGEDISELCGRYVAGDTETCVAEAKQRNKLRTPESPCICLMQGLATPHAGVYIDGRVLHLTPQGAKLETLTSLKVLYRLSFYR